MLGAVPTGQLQQSTTLRQRQWRLQALLMDEQQQQQAGMVANPFAGPLQQAQPSWGICRWSMTCLYVAQSVAACPPKVHTHQPAHLECKAVIACTPHSTACWGCTRRMHLVPRIPRSHVLLPVLAAPGCRHKPHLGTMCQPRGQHMTNKCWVESCSRWLRWRWRPQLASWMVLQGNSQIP